MLLLMYSSAPCQQIFEFCLGAAFMQTTGPMHRKGTFPKLSIQEELYFHAS